MYDILKPSVFWKIWRRGPLTSLLGGGSDGLDPALTASLLYVQHLKGLVWTRASAENFPGGRGRGQRLFQGRPTKKKKRKIAKKAEKWHF